MKRNLLWTLGALLCLAPSCSGPTEPTDNLARANFINGDFESGDLTGWMATTATSPNGLGVVPPTQYSDLRLSGTGTAKTFVRMGATPESQVPAGLAAGDSLKYPRFGQYSTVVNETGNLGNSNQLQQTITTVSSDIDPIDNKIHVRFCLAPVLENPNHAAKDQPYFYVEVNNTTQNKRLFTSFNFGGQAGVPWKTSSTGRQYTDWQLFDLAPDTTDLAVGDQVSMTVVATGCQPGGHFGEVYVDGFGTFIPGLTITASAAAFAQVDTDLVYTFQAGNGGATNVDNVVVTETLPPGTTFVSLNGASGCTTPAVGASGTISCPLGTINAGAGSNFQVTVHIANNATGPITNGNYTIQGTGVSSLIGPKVETQIGYLIDSKVLGGNGTLSCPAGVVQGRNAVCTITPNMGFSVLLLDLDGTDVKAGISNGTYTLTNVMANHSLTAIFNAQTYSISSTVPGGNGTVSCTSPVIAGSSSVCTITPATGFTLSAITDNGGNVLGSVQGNSYTIANVQAGHSVQAAFQPATYPITATVAGGNGMLSCTTPVTHGMSSTCTITPAAGYSLSTLTLDGADVAASVSNNSYVLTNVTAPHLVQATFAKALYTINVNVPGGNGTISCTNPVVAGASAVCSLQPGTGYWLDTLMLDGSDVLGMVNGTSFTIPNVMANHTLNGTFALASYPITSSVPGGNGTIVCGTPIARGQSTSCTITPATGYGLVTLTLDGSDVLGQVSGNGLPINNVTASHLVQGTFQLTTSVITVSIPGGHGTIDCTSPVVYGLSGMCRITPAPGYRLSALTLDDFDIKGQVSGNSFVINSITAPVSVAAAFEMVPSYTITVSVPNGNGTVVCTSPIVEGQNSNCTITPNAGYELDGMLLDGVDARILVQGSALNLYNVTAPHFVNASFKKARANGCTTNAECHSGVCADGVCCDRACDGQCEACNLAESAGTCTAKTSGQPAEGHPSCGYYQCGGNGCQTECQSDAECLTGSVCSNHVCIPGTHSLSGGGIAGCSAAPNANSSANASGLGVLALFALLALKRRTRSTVNV